MCLTPGMEFWVCFDSLHSDSISLSHTSKALWGPSQPWGGRQRRWCTRIGQVCVLGGKQKAKRWAIPWFWHISGQCWVYDYEVGWCFALWKTWAKKMTSLDQTTIISGHAMKDRSSKAALRKTLTSCSYWADFAQNQSQEFQKKV